jgi:hypothetical protein
MNNTGGTRHHMSASIEGLLQYSNKELERLLEIPGKEARNILLHKKANGEKVIPCGDCEGFDPVTGCPGHPINATEQGEKS